MAKSSAIFLLILFSFISLKVNCQIDTSIVTNLEVNVDKPLRINLGLSVTAYYDKFGNYFYEVCEDSSVMEFRNSNQSGGMISMVLYFDMVRNEYYELAGVLNFPLLKISSDNQTGTFNKKTPIGIGMAYRRKNVPVLITGMINLSQVKRLGNSKRNSNTFLHEEPNSFLDLSNYSNFTYNETKAFVNLGVIFPVEEILGILNVLN